MPRHARCRVPGCRNYAECPTYPFPSDSALCQKWFELIKIPAFLPEKNSKNIGVLCGKHFLSSDYECDVNVSRGRPTLKEGAVPSLFLPATAMKEPGLTQNLSTTVEEERANTEQKGHSAFVNNPQPSPSMTESTNTEENKSESVKLQDSPVPMVTSESRDSELENKPQEKYIEPSQSRLPPFLCGTKNNAVSIFGRDLSRIVEPVALNLCYAVQGLASTVSQQQAQFLQLVESVEKIQCKQDSLKTEFEDFMLSAKLNKQGKTRKLECPPFSYGYDYLGQVKRQKRHSFISGIQYKKCRPDTVKFLEEMRHVKGRRVTVPLIQRNPELCEKYTGFSNYVQLKEVFDKIVSDRHFITPTKDTGNSSVRKLSLESEFLMTLVKIKLLVPLCYLCSQYKVSRRVVRETVVKWTGVLLETLRRVESESENSSLQPLITITKRFLDTQGLMTNEHIQSEPIETFVELV